MNSRDIKWDTRVYCRIDRDLKDLCERVARDQGLTLSEWLRRWLCEGVSHDLRDLRKRRPSKREG